MKELGSAFQSHLDGEVTTLCNCWIVSRSDDEKLGFSDHDKMVVVDGVDCEPGSGFEASQMEETTGLTPENHDVAGALLSERISAKDIEARKYDGARINHYVVNWSDPEELVLMNTYLFGEIIREDGVFRAELLSPASLLDETRLCRFEKHCRANLGDAACGIDLGSGYTYNMTISQVLSDDTILLTGLGSLEDGWFSGGRMIIHEGTDNEQAIEIRLHSINEAGDDMLTLWAPPHKALSQNDPVKLTPGCDKQLSTCQRKFANVVNFRGYPFMPGPEFAVSYASNSEKMDGGPLIP